MTQRAATQRAKSSDLNLETSTTGVTNGEYCFSDTGHTIFTQQHSRWRENGEGETLTEKTEVVVVHEKSATVTLQLSHVLQIIIFAFVIMPITTNSAELTRVLTRRPHVRSDVAPRKTLLFECFVGCVATLTHRPLSRT